MADIKLQRAETIIGYAFHDKTLLWEALQIAGSGETRIGGRNIPKGNERMAVYGDSVLSAMLSESWFHKDATKGQLDGVDWLLSHLKTTGMWTAWRGRLLGNENLSRVGFSTGLDQCLNMNRFNTVLVSAKMSATLVEAVVGALALDGTVEDVKKVLENLGININNMVKSTTFILSNRVSCVASGHVARHCLHVNVA